MTRVACFFSRRLTCQEIYGFMLTVSVDQHCQSVGTLLYKIQTVDQAKSSMMIGCLPSNTALSSALNRPITQRDPGEQKSSFDSNWRLPFCLDILHLLWLREGVNRRDHLWGVQEKTLASSFLWTITEACGYVLICGFIPTVLSNELGYKGMLLHQGWHSVLVSLSG